MLIVTVEEARLLALELSKAAAQKARRAKTAPPAVQGPTTNDAETEPRNAGVSGNQHEARE